jgi:hypothetical protein
VRARRAAGGGRAIRTRRGGRRGRLLPRHAVASCVHAPAPLPATPPYPTVQTSAPRVMVPRRATDEQQLPPLFLLLLLLPAMAAADSKDCGPNCFGSKANRECDTVDECFFSGCTCEYRRWKSGCEKTDFCVGWKTTGGCDPHTGKRKPQDDKDCCQYVPTGWSGYCECDPGNGGNITRIQHMRCWSNKLDNFRDGQNIVCQEACQEYFCEGAGRSVYQGAECDSIWQPKPWMIICAVGVCAFLFCIRIVRPSFRVGKKAAETAQEAKAEAEADLRRRQQQQQQQQQQQRQQQEADAAAAAQHDAKLRDEVELLRSRLEAMEKQAQQQNGGAVVTGIPMQHPLGKPQSWPWRQSRACTAAGCHNRA